MVVSTLAKALIKQRKLFADILKKQRGTVFSKPKWVDAPAEGIRELEKLRKAKYYRDSLGVKRRATDWVTDIKGVTYPGPMKRRKFGRKGYVRYTKLDDALWTQKYKFKRALRKIDVEKEVQKQRVRDRIKGR